MSSFGGFDSGKTKPTPIPADFFTDLLSEIDDLGELKVTLYAFWHLDHQEDELRYLCLTDFTADERFANSFGKTKDEIERNVTGALERAVRRGVLLTANSTEETFYFLNSPQGRAALEALEAGSWNPASTLHPQLLLNANRPNIFTIYEKNIGPLTPIIADTLKEAENLYPADWIVDAVKIAVTRNVRNWQYIEAILRSWKEKGRDEKDQRTSKENRKRDSEGEFGDYIIH
jgi:DNA replication protein